MADTGINWDAAWTAIDTALAHQEGEASAESISAVIDLDGKAACTITIDVDYSNHAKATGGLFVYLLADINGTDYEVEADGPWGFEMPFTQNDTHRRKFFVDPKTYNKFKLMLDWDNSTTDSIATVTTKVKYGTIPVAS